MAGPLRDYSGERSCSEVGLARIIDVSGPTVGRMLYPDRQGGDGVAIRSWMRALQLTGHLDDFVEALEDSAVDRTRGSRKGQFFVINKSPLGLSGDHSDAMSVEDESRVNSSLERAGQALHAVLATTPLKSVRQLAMRMGVTQPTLISLFSPSGDRAGGTAIKQFLRVASILNMSDAIVSSLPKAKARSNTATRHHKDSQDLDFRAI